MDRMERDLGRDHPPALAEPTRERPSRTLSPGSAHSRSTLRLDRGHHPASSGRDRIVRWRGLAESAAPRCSTLIASREAEVLAAMVNSVVGPGPKRGDNPRCVATIAGRSARGPSGVVELRSDVAVAADYLLLPAEPTGDESAAGGARAETVEVERYSLDPGADWWAGDLRGRAGCYRFRAYYRGAYRVEVQLRVPGVHQVLAALAAVAIGVRVDRPVGSIRDRLEAFPGIPRGFESRGSFRGATLVDDEASGVESVATALGLAREVFGRRTLRAVYGPHDRLDLDPSQEPIADEFRSADHLILVDGRGDRGESTRLLAATLRSSGASVAQSPSVDEAIRVLDGCLEPGDVLVTLGAGVGAIADAFLRRLSGDRHG